MMKMIVLALVAMLQGDGARKPLADDDWRLLSKVVYECGQITADRQWQAVITASKSTVHFEIDPAKSDRDWQVNHCDDVLHIAQVTK